MSFIMDKNKEAILLQDIWNHIHDLLNEAIIKNDHKSAEYLGKVASFMRQIMPDEIKLNLTKEYRK